MGDSTVRRVLRGVFTREANQLRDLLNSSADLEQHELKARMLALSSRYDKIKMVDNAILLAMESDPQVNDCELESQYEGIGEYDLTFMTLREQVIATLDSLSKTDNKTLVFTPTCTHSQNTDVPLKLKRPDIKKFDGNLRGWIAFWSQFKKIDEDPKLEEEDKFAFLLDSLTPGSAAMKLIEGFPPSRENYAKAVGVLKSRYGKDEFLIEFYVRELLSLVLNRSEDSSVSQLYDKLSAQLRALDSLGVTKEKYAAMIFPLVESAVPEHVFKVWERHRISKNASIKEPGDCLSELLEFLKIEVEGEERLKMRQNSFGSSSERSQNPIEPKVPTAAALVSLDNKDNKTDVKDMTICIFCDKSHMSSDCSAAIDMSLSERNDIVKKKGACFCCLRRNHLSSNCLTFVKCVLCKGKHYTLMCNKTEDTGDKKGNMEVKSMLLNDAGLSITYLQTLVAKVINEGQEYNVRILLDSGSQKSYILKSCVKKFKLKREGKILVRQELFGGQKTSVKSHGKYTVTLGSLTSSFQCCINVLDQEKICGFIPKISDSSVIECLQSKGIILSDALNNSLDTQEIQLLLGADSWALLMTNDGVRLNENLMATQTKLGWVLIGSSGQKEEDTATLLTTLTCQIDVSNCWHLDLPSIEDSIKKMTQAEKDREMEEFFKRTIQRDCTGRFISKVPWIPGLVNPVEALSIGCNPEQLVSSKWWEEPSWLYLPETECPNSKCVEETTEMTVIDLTEEEVLSVGREPDEEDPTQDESETIFTRTGRLMKPREILDL